LQNNKVVLVYGFNENQINHIAELLQNDVKAVEPSMGKMKIRDILNGVNLAVCNFKYSEERVVLFNNFEDEELKKSIGLIKSILQPAPIFAIVTETSIEWTFEYLLEHLIEERACYKNHGK
jgi:hypothetical protein